MNFQNMVVVLQFCSAQILRIMNFQMCVVVENKNVKSLVLINGNTDICNATVNGAKGQRGGDPG